MSKGLLQGDPWLKMYRSLPDLDEDAPQLSRQEEKKLKPPLAERARLVVSLSCVDKYGLGFLCGCLIALRDLKLMRHTRVWAASGQAVLLQAWLQVLTIQRGWDAICTPPTLSEADPLQELVNLVMGWCDTEHELSFLKARLCRCRWSQWLDPWSEELALWLERKYQLGKLWKKTPLQPQNPLLYPVPVWLYGADLANARTAKAFYLSSDTKHIEVPNLSIRTTSRETVGSHFSRFLAASLWHPDLEITVSAVANKTHATRLVPSASTVPSTWKLSNSLRVDPLNLRVCGTYFMNERLNVLPHTDAMQPDLQGREEEDATQKLLLLDAFTWSPGSEAYDQSTRLTASVTHEEVLSAADQKKERLLCFRKQYVTLFEGEELMMGSEAHYEPYRTFAEALKRHIHLVGGAQLTSVDRNWLELCINAGYYRTFQAYAPRGLIPRELIDTNDPYHLRRSLFPRAR